MKMARIWGGPAGSFPDSTWDVREEWPGYWDSHLPLWTWLFLLCGFTVPGLVLFLKSNL